MKELRYRLYLAGKVVVAAFSIYVLHYSASHAGSIFSVLGAWLAAAGILFLVIWDPRRRCRTCLRPLIMPLRTGSWGNMLTWGRPTVELICPYGHGTLRIDELQITGKDMPDWRRHDDNIWKELESYYEAPK